MALYFEKRYDEVEFGTGWTKSTNATTGVRTYTAAEGATVDIHTAGGHRQEHVMGAGDKVICSGGDVQVEVG